MKCKKTLRKKTSLKKKSNITNIQFDGKSYKLTLKKTCVNFRYNKSNLNLFLYKNIKLVSHKFKKKIYIYPLNKTCIRKSIGKNLNKIRKVNTYTQRGIFPSDLVFYKRVGRVSGYV